MAFHPIVIFQSLLIALLVGAACQDALKFRISNRWVIAIALLFIPFAYFAALGSTITWHLAHFGLALAGGIGLFALGWLGGGDAKLYAALALWFPLEWSVQLLVAVAFAGCAEMLLYLAFGRYLSQGEQPSSWRTRRIPYGVAIAVGGILMILAQRLSASA
jgi:prepilin peptidase CpaA